ncbi:hypothetical protein E4U54_002113, partial [Claviceps lovelessii]
MHHASIIDALDKQANQQRHRTQRQSFAPAYGLRPTDCGLRPTDCGPRAADHGHERWMTISLCHVVSTGFWCLVWCLVTISRAASVINETARTQAHTHAVEEHVPVRPL